MGGGGAPDPPDYTGAAEATAKGQSEAVTQQTWANRVNQVGPWGSTTWDATGTDPVTGKQIVDPATGKPVTQWTQHTNLDPRVQAALDSQMSMQQTRSTMAEGLLGRMQDEYGQPMDWSGLQGYAGTPQGGNLQATTQANWRAPQQTTQAEGGVPGAITSAYGFGGQMPTTSAFGMGPQQQNIDTSRMQAPSLQRGLDFGGVQDVQGSGASRQAAEDAIYQSATSRLDPQYEARQRSMETDLANRGITRGSEAYDQAMTQMGRERTDAYAQAQMASITGAGAEAQRNQGMDLALRGQQVGEIGQQGQFANTAAGQAFGFGQAARDQQLGAQQAAFGMGLQGSQFGLNQQQQAFQQGIGAQENIRAQQGQAYEQQMGSAQQRMAQQNQAYQQAAQSGQLGLAAQQQAFAQQQQAGQQNYQQAMGSAQYQNTMRQQQLAEMMQQRGFSLNEMQALISGQQVSMPQFSGYNAASLGGSPDYMAAAGQNYGAQMDEYSAGQQRNAQVQQGIGTMAMVAAVAY